MHLSKHLAHLLFSLGLLLAAGGCSGKPDANKPDPNKPGDNKPNPAAKNDGPSPSEAKADFPPLSAADFVKEFTADESAAAKKYKDKALVIEGTIAEKLGDPDMSGGIRLILTGEAGDKPINVRTELGMFDPYTVDQFKKLKPGDKVKVNGELMFATIKKSEGKPSEIELNVGKLVK